MAIRFPAEMKNESKYYNRSFISEIEEIKFNTNVLLFIFFIQITRK